MTNLFFPVTSFSLKGTITDLGSESFPNLLISEAAQQNKEEAEKQNLAKAAKRTEDMDNEELKVGDRLPWLSQSHQLLRLLWWLFALNLGQF